MSWPELKTRVGNLELSGPLIAASGVWPMEPELWPREALTGLAAYCSKGLTRHPQAGNPGIRLWETPAGMLNSIGLQNKGVRHFAEVILPRLKETGLPLVVNLAPHSSDEIPDLLAPLVDVQDSIAVLELNISCPNVSAGGMAWGKTTAGAREAVEPVRELWPGELWVKLTPQAADPALVAQTCREYGADGLVVANTWLGMAMNLKTGKPAMERVVAGLSGPAIFPLTLRCVWEVCGAVEIPVVGCGGVSSWEDAAAMILAGASAIQIGTGLMTDLNLPARICRGLSEYLKKNSYSSLDQMIGAGRE